MTTISGYYHSDLDVSTTLRVTGTVEGTVKVEQAGVFELDGTVIGNVIARRGSTVLVNGYVKGRLENFDGSVTLNGVAEELYDDPGGQPTQLGPNAYVGKK